MLAPLPGSQRPAASAPLLWRPQKRRDTTASAGCTVHLAKIHRRLVAASRGPCVITHRRFPFFRRCTSRSPGTLRTVPTASRHLKVPMRVEPCAAAPGTKVPTRPGSAGFKQRVGCGWLPQAATTASAPGAGCPRSALVPGRLRSGADTAGDRGATAAGWGSQPHKRPPRPASRGGSYNGFTLRRRLAAAGRAEGWGR